MRIKAFSIGLIAFALASPGMGQIGNVGFNGTIGLTGTLGGSPVAGGGGGGGGPTYTLSDDYEETGTGGALGSGTDGYDSALVAATAGTVNPDYTAVALLGSQSLYITSGGNVRYTLGSTYNEVDAYFMFRTPTLPSAALNNIFNLRDGSGNSQLFLYLRTDGTLDVFQGNGGPDTRTVGTLSAATTYSIWVHWKNDGTASVAFAAYTGSQTRPTSGNNYAAVTGGTGNTAIQQFLLQANGGSDDTIWDRLRATSGALIPDNP